MGEHGKHLRSWYSQTNGEFYNFHGTTLMTTLSARMSGRGTTIMIPGVDLQGCLKEHDPDGTSQAVAVIMKGPVYRNAGLKNSQYPRIEGALYDKLCKFEKSKLRDDVRKLAIHIAHSLDDYEFSASVDWLDSFMRRFCLSKKKLQWN